MAKDFKTYAKLKFVVKNYKTLGRNGLAKKFKVAPVTIWSWVNGMRKAGLKVESRTGRGSHISICDFVRQYTREQKVK